MDDQVTTTDQALERGRYALYATPDGGYTVARAVELCDRCLDCGCGSPGAALEAPGWLVKMAQSQGGMMAKVRGLLGAARNNQAEYFPASDAAYEAARRQWEPGEGSDDG